MRNARSQRRHTVSSYGVVCYRMRIDFDARCLHPEFLLVQRKDSMSFVEFSRGKFSSDDAQYVRSLLGTMTADEKRCVATRTFDELWLMVWGGRAPSSTRCGAEYAAAKQTHENLLAACGGSLASLVADVPDALDEREFGFPKGRRSAGETDLQAAVREFHEETGVDPTCVHLHDMRPLEEVFQGSNGVLYRHVYFLARLVDMRGTPSETPNPDSAQALEVSSVQWAPFAEVCEKFAQSASRLRVAERANAEIIKMLAPDPRSVRMTPVGTDDDAQQKATNAMLDSTGLPTPTPHAMSACAPLRRTCTSAGDVARAGVPMTPYCAQTFTYPSPIPTDRMPMIPPVPPSWPPPTNAPAWCTHVPPPRAPIGPPPGLCPRPIAMPMLQTTAEPRVANRTE